MRPIVVAAVAACIMGAGVAIADIIQCQVQNQCEGSSYCEGDVYTMEGECIRRCYEVKDGGLLVEGGLAICRSIKPE